MAKVAGFSVGLKNPIPQVLFVMNSSRFYHRDNKNINVAALSRIERQETDEKQVHRKL